MFMVLFFKGSLMACNHTIHRHNHHFGWDKSLEPILSVSPGKSIEIETIDSSGGQLSTSSTSNDLSNLSNLEKDIDLDQGLKRINKIMPI